MTTMTGEPGSGDDDALLLTMVRGDVHAAAEAVCRLVRARVEAAAVSVALHRERTGTLVYIAADGAGSDRVVGMEVPVEASVAGYVALAGDSIALADVATDPRFNREAAEATGYVPRALTVMPIAGEQGVVAVISVLDAGVDDVDEQVRDLVPILAAVVRAAVPLDPFATEGQASLQAMRQLAAALMSGGSRERRLLRALVSALDEFVEAGR